MAFVPPTFNLTANVWHNPNPVTNPPDLVVSCQLRAPGKQSGFMALTATVLILSWEILFPALTDIRDARNGLGQDLVEVPAGSGRLYEGLLVDDVAKGFTNEYRILYVQKAGNWPTPIP